MSMRYSPPVSGFRARIGDLFGLKGKEDNEDEVSGVLDVDEDGTTLFKEDIIQKVLDDLQNRKQERSILEQQWTLNANFLVGN